MGLGWWIGSGDNKDGADKGVLRGSWRSTSKNHDHGCESSHAGMLRSSADQQSYNSPLQCPAAGAPVRCCVARACCIAARRCGRCAYGRCTTSKCFLRVSPCEYYDSCDALPCLACCMPQSAWLPQLATGPTRHLHGPGAEAHAGSDAVASSASVSTGVSTSTMHPLLVGVGFNCSCGGKQTAAPVAEPGARAASIAHASALQAASTASTAAFIDGMAKPAAPPLLARPGPTHLMQPWAPRLGRAGAQLPSTFPAPCTPQQQQVQQQRGFFVWGSGMGSGLTDPSQRVTNTIIAICVVAYIMGAANSGIVRQFAQVWTWVWGAEGVGHSWGQIGKQWRSSPLCPGVESGVGRRGIGVSWGQGVHSDVSCQFTLL